jgi:hypothetical protein
VLVTADAGYAMSLAGQHLLQMLVNLLARQFGVVADVLVDVPDVPLRAGVILVPRVDSGSLRGGLLALGKAVGAGVTRTRLFDGPAPTVLVHVGGNWNPAASRVPAIAVSGGGWRLAARTDDVVIAVGSGESSNPLGPYMAACVGAAFAFKSAFGKHGPTRCEINLWRDAGDGPELSGVGLPTAYILGGGAVGAAFSYTLAAADGLTGCLIAVDPQPMSDTDCNRLLSGATADIGTLKVDLITRLFAEGTIDAHGVRGRWPDEYLADPNRRVPNSVRGREADLRFEWVISCVDRDRDRVGIARTLPRHVLSGSTFGMLAQTAYYSGAGECECLGCQHRTPPQLGVEAMVEQLRSLGPQERAAWYVAHGATAQERNSIQEYLSDPTCAGPGEADLARLGVSGAVDWAVGFVSAGAGVLLAARFIRAAITGVDEEIRPGSELRYFAWSNELESSRAKRAVVCPVCFELSDMWHELWH